MKRHSLLSLALLCFFWGTDAHACPGDCNGDGSVTPDEIRRGVEVALLRSAGDCQQGFGEGIVTVDQLVVAVRARLDTCSAVPATPTPTLAATPTATVAVSPIFPADYRSTFVEVRDCRFSTEHGGVNIRVLANPIAVQPYIAEQNPLPGPDEANGEVGSIVVKEEFAVKDGSNGPDCSDANLIQWRAMRKEAPGFDPVDGDWHWQWVNLDRSVRFDDKSTCISCHTRPECLARDHMCTVDDTSLNPVLQDLAVPLLSVSGTSPSNVFAVGMQAEQDPLGPLVLHYNGAAWQRLDTKVAEDLWWVSVVPIDGLFYISGDGGVILQLDPATNAFTRMETPTTALLYGIWGTAANDLWAVGADPNLTEDKAGVVLHYDGSAWTLQDLSGVIATGLPSLFKVWGRSASEVYAVGQGGTIIRYDGSHWARVESNSLETLFTVHGNATQVFAVGGFIEPGVILELEGDAFQDHAPAGLHQMNGVFVPAQGLPAAVGFDLGLARRTAQGWQLRQESPGFALGFHAVWIDSEGGTWAVGGNFNTNTAGLLQYAGSRTISSVIEQPARCPTGETGGGTVSYANQIEPLLRQSRCLDLGCHGGAFPSSGYDQRTYASSFKQGVEAKSLDVCPLVPGDPDSSFLIEKLLSNPRPTGSARMPNGFPPLTDPQVDLIRTWIMEGARNN